MFAHVNGDKFVTKFSSTPKYAPPKIKASCTITKIIALDASPVFVIYPMPRPKLVAKRTSVSKISKTTPR